jgi:hypothetical protein
LLIDSLALAPVASADDANHFIPIREPHSKNSLAHYSEAVETLLGSAVREIASNHALWIQECLLGKAETDAVLTLVLRVLVGIPLEACNTAKS